jgi:hypothetical protein
LLLALPARVSAGQDNPTTQLQPDQPLESTRLIFGPTARMLKPGEVYAAAYAVLLPMVQVGVTPRFSFGGGILPGSFDEGIGFWLTPKVQLHRSERTSVAAGLLQFVVPGEFKGGLAFGNVTREVSPDAAWTLGAGWAYSTDKGTFRFASGVPMLQFGFEKRVSSRLAFVTDDYFLWGGGLLTGGLRVELGRFRADLGALFLVFDGDVAGAPVVNVAWTFHR